MNTGLSTDVREQQSGNYVLIRDVENNQLGKFDKRLPCCGCGIGWFSFLLGFVFPLMWYYATILYFGKYYHKDPRERGGLAANAVAGRGKMRLGQDVLLGLSRTISRFSVLTLKMMLTVYTCFVLENIFLS
ncbi:hypothetical protein TEA_029823 [Camellia sinensis var. sinensis]|uniref:Uncharacterized protein n=1 Tax=Camellia sinensis var. sinensis TaxID=542762 RepID=A0A4S4D638_CAMSN|nr:hypothetical protein TEA_029823 [Camellia sinensis var. sinensis]